MALISENIAVFLETSIESTITRKNNETNKKKQICKYNKEAKIYSFNYSQQSTCVPAGSWLHFKNCRMS